MKYRILLITNNYFPNQGGITTYLNNLNEGLNSKHNIRSSVIKVDYSNYSNKAVRYLFFLFSLIYIVLFGVYNKILGFRVIVHSHSANYCLLFSYITKKTFSNIALHTFHSPINKSDFILKNFTHKLDSIGYVSNHTKQLYKKFDVPSNKSEFILPGSIDLNPFLNKKNYSEINKKKINTICR